MADFSDYIVYVDESGDHGLQRIDPNFPVFGLSFCIFKKADYTEQIVPAVQDLKFRYWGHDAIILHEREIRRSIGDFKLPNETYRQFTMDLTELIEGAPFKVIGSVINKTALLDKNVGVRNPYHIALRFCMEELRSYLISNDQKGRRVHVVLESRGNKEDQDLEREFGNIVAEDGFDELEFESKFAKKTTNSTGLQLADLTAGPIARHSHRPDQQSRDFERIKGKLVGFRDFPHDPE